jgi:hypothetical protein
MFRRESFPYRMSRGWAFMALSASAYFTPQVLPRYRAMASFACWWPVRIIANQRQNDDAIVLRDRLQQNARHSKHAIVVMSADRQ